MKESKSNVSRDEIPVMRVINRMLMPLEAPEPILSNRASQIPKLSATRDKIDDLEEVI